jgi:hypothetical protein
MIKAHASEYVTWYCWRQSTQAGQNKAGRGRRIGIFMVKNYDNVVCLPPDKTITINITPLLINCATRRKVAGSIPGKVIVFFI